jgi:hypothetical protein
MKFGIHIGHMGGPLGEMRKLWKFADAKGFDWFRAMAEEFRALGCTRLSIALREGPYDWEALEAFAAEIVRPG